jgi:hypothetical protein
MALDDDEVRAIRELRFRPLRRREGLVASRRRLHGAIERLWALRGSRARQDRDGDDR